MTINTISFYIELVKTIPILILFGVYIYILFDILKSDFKGKYSKYGWIFLITLIPVLGLALYWFIIKRKTKYLKDNLRI